MSPNRLPRPFNIGFEAKRAFENHRGLGSYARGIISGLAKYFPQNHYHLYSPRKNEDLFPQAFQTPNLHPHFAQGPYKYLPGQFFRSWGVLNDFQNLDLYHGLSHEIPVSFFKKTKKIPLVVTIHDLIYLTHPELFPYLDRKIYHLKFKHSASASDLIIAVSHQTKNDLVHYFKIHPDKIKVCYQSCAPAFYSPLPDSDLQNIMQTHQIPDSFLLSLGAFEARKNFLTLIEAYSRIYSNAPALIIAGRGEGPYYKKMVKLIGDLGLRSSIRIIQAPPKELVRALYQKATLFAFPSLLEGFGIPNIEALFSHTPVVTSERPELRESAGPGALYVDPHSPEDIAEKLEFLLQDKNRRQELATLGHKYVQRFHIEQTTDQLYQNYLALLR